ncbi:hypothetical protein F4779DRAFT_453705 [Xylariaceae sp. FL0662B]|nr:hypothetical protein F4779DRAFT_453705 [Xylariaceae sp. FL0662B]
MCPSLLPASSHKFNVAYGALLIIRRLVRLTIQFTVRTASALPTPPHYRLHPKMSAMFIIKLALATVVGSFISYYSNRLKELEATSKRSEQGILNIRMEMDIGLPDMETRIENIQRRLEEYELERIKEGTEIDLARMERKRRIQEIRARAADFKATRRRHTSRSASVA